MGSEVSSEELAQEVKEGTNIAVSNFPLNLEIKPDLISKAIQAEPFSSSKQPVFLSL